MDTFPLLDKYPYSQAVFLAKQPDIDVRTEREKALQRLKQSHLQTLSQLGFEGLPAVEAEQIHGNGVAVVTSPISTSPYPGVDALVTSVRRVCLKIFVADCAAVYLLDRQSRAIGLVHSGRKGTELEIVPATIHSMQKALGVSPKDLVMQISPCIRPPHYEVDFAAHIRQQAAAAGVEQIEDCGHCTACNPMRYYSYRMEKGATGRMVAALTLL